jgi:hypothetical protein
MIFNECRLVNLTRIGVAPDTHVKSIEELIRESL